MDFGKFIEWAFLGLLTGGVYILWLMNESLGKLNVSIAVIIERTDRHEILLEKQDIRIRDLETKN